MYYNTQHFLKQHQTYSFYIRLRILGKLFSLPAAFAQNSRYAAVRYENLKRSFSLRRAPSVTAGFVCTLFFSLIVPRHLPRQGGFDTKSLIQRTNERVPVTQGSLTEGAVSVADWGSSPDASLFSYLTPHYAAFFFPNAYQFLFSLFYKIN